MTVGAVDSKMEQPKVLTDLITFTRYGQELYSIIFAVTHSKRNLNLEIINAQKIERIVL